MSAPERSTSQQVFRTSALVFAVLGLALIIYEAVSEVTYPGWVYPAAIAVTVGLLWAAWPYRDSVRQDRRSQGEAARTTTPQRPAVNWTHVQLVVLFTLLAWYGTRNVLHAYDANGHLGPQDAPDILVACGGISALLTAISLAVSRILRADGAQRRARGEGEQARGEGQAAKARAGFEGQATLARAEHEGQAAQTRAEYEGQAALALAKAALRRADAEYLRAEKGIDPLPAPGDPTGPPAIGPAPGPNGARGSTPPALPPGAGEAGTL